MTTKGDVGNESLNGSSATNGLGLDRSVLAREGRSATAWTTHLRELAASVRTYRSGFELEDLLSVAEDPSTTVEDRVAATLILARVADDYRPRLRIAAEGTIDTNLRDALITAIDDGTVDERAMRRAIGPETPTASSRSTGGTRG